MQATELLSYFETKTNEGKTTYHIKADAPDEVTKLIYDCHDEELPNDWRYDSIHSIITQLSDLEEIDEDTAHEIADSEVDVYNADLINWLNGHVARSFYCDEAASEYGLPQDALMIKRIQVGQYYALLDMTNQIISFLN